MCIEDGYEINPRHQQIVAHVILALHTWGGTEIGADGDVRRTRYIAGLSKTEAEGGKKLNWISKQ